MADPIMWELDQGTGSKVKVDVVLLFYHKDDYEKFWVSKDIASNN